MTRPGFMPPNFDDTYYNDSFQDGIEEDIDFENDFDHDEDDENVLNSIFPKAKFQQQIIRRIENWDNDYLD